MFVKEDNGYIGLNYELEEITVEEYLVSVENGKLINNKTGRTYKKIGYNKLTYKKFL